MLNAITFTLPMPPSVNAIWRSGNGRVYNSQEYKAWKLEAGLVLNKLRIPSMQPPYRVQYAFGRKDKRTRDLMNFEKALSDLLESQKILTNDSKINDARLFWDDAKLLVEPGFVHCTVESL